MSMFRQGLLRLGSALHSSCMRMGEGAALDHPVIWVSTSCELESLLSGPSQTDSIA